eukprot:jgi/Mesvir1/7706/Mv11663-RA.27
MASLTSSFLTGSQLKVASFQSASLSQGKKLGRGVPGLKPVPARAPVVACLAPKSTNDLSAAPKEEAANAVMELSSTSLLRGFEAPLRNLMSSVGMVPAAAPGTPSAGLNLGTILVLAAAIVSSAAQMANAATNPSSMGAAIDESLGHLAHGAPDASMGAQLQKAGAALPLIAAAGLNAGELSSTVSRLAPTVLPLAVGGSLATVGWTMLSKARSSSARPVALIQREADILNKAQKVVEANNMTRTFEEALADRTAVVGKYYPGATNLEDFISRAEVALFENGFVGENTIACLNVCRDEVCEPMREAVEDVFGSSFMVNGLGGMLTCGVTGVKAGISHSPVLGGRERYVFFSFPHIAIDSSGKVGAIHRPGRGQESTACGAMIGALGTIKANGVEPECKVKGVHEPHDCEFSICRARMARTLKAKGMNPADVDLVKFTAAAEERITHDLEDLIMDAVDTSKADYAVITGIQIHAWEAEANEKELLEGGNKDRHDFEFVLPGKAYCVINGERKEMDLSALPALTPRMITLMRNAKMSKEGPSGGRFAMPTAAGATVATRLLTDRKTIQVASTVPPPAVVAVEDNAATNDIERAAMLQKHFPYFLGYEDFVSRVEISLHKFGFESYNSIACINLCRDEITGPLKQKIDKVFGSSFNVNGLGGVLTCGVTGLKAGLSHSPTCKFSGRERYVFFSFPHIAVDADGNIGRVPRPNRDAPSTACGALIASLGEIKAVGPMALGEMAVGTHNAKDPEYSILKQRLARATIREGKDVADLDLVGITKIAERMITEDLENLIMQAVDIKKADYAVITGIQIHNWASENDKVSLEVVAPCSAYAVINGVRKDIDIIRTPSLAPRQIELLGNAEADGF